MDVCGPNFARMFVGECLPAAAARLAPGALRGPLPAWQSGGHVPTQGASAAREQGPSCGISAQRRAAAASRLWVVVPLLLRAAKEPRLLVTQPVDLLKTLQAVSGALGLKAPEAVQWATRNGSLLVAGLTQVRGASGVLWVVGGRIWEVGRRGRGWRASRRRVVVAFPSLRCVRRGQGEVLEAPLGWAGDSCWPPATPASQLRCALRLGWRVGCSKETR